MRSHLTLVALLACASLVLPLVGAHPYVLTVGTGVVPVGEGRTFYFVSEDGSMWEETNGKLDQGVESYAPGATGMRGPSGLQVHDVCYGTFTEDEVDQWNWDVSGGHYGYDSATGQGQPRTNRLYNYVAWEGTEAECEAIAGATFVAKDTPVHAGP